MKLIPFFIVMFLIFGSIIYALKSIAPPEVFTTTDWRVAAKYERECYGTSKVQKVLDEYRITCER